MVYGFGGERVAPEWVTVTSIADAARLIEEQLAQGQPRSAARAVDQLHQYADVGRGRRCLRRRLRHGFTGADEPV
jgi:hypothetical protein